MNNLLLNIDKIHTTKMGMERIRRNLKLDNNDVVDYCKRKISDKKGYDEVIIIDGGYC